MEKNLEKLLRVMCVEADSDPTHVAREIGMTPQNFIRKMKAGNLRFSEVVDAMKALGYKVYAEKDGEKLDIY